MRNPTFLTIRLAICLAGFAALVLGGDVNAKPHGRAAWDGKSHVVHEWGTFTSLQGSDGVVLDGLRHEERDLPEFVHDLRDVTGITGVSPKMETPVIYFYSPDERKVAVRVWFPRGAITQWYPAANGVNHMGPTVNGTPTTAADKLVDSLREGFICWGRRSELTILGREQAPVLPAVSADDPWRFCRQVDANSLRTCSLNLARRQSGNPHPKKAAYEYEKCLFYRGLGDFALPLVGQLKKERISKDRYRARLHLANTTPGEPIEHIFLIHVGAGRSGFQYMRVLEDTEAMVEVDMALSPQAVSTEALVEKLAGALTRTGLYRKEALAMARTWQQGYFQDEGFRVLYVLPKAMIDRELPLEVEHIRVRRGEAKKAKAVDWKIVRTFVGRTELLSPERETRMDAVVTDFATGDAAARAAASKALDQWGRFAIPYLHRVLALSKDESVRADVEALLGKLKLLRR